MLDSIQDGELESARFEGYRVKPRPSHPLNRQRKWALIAARWVRKDTGPIPPG
jgi:hypothetical protein